jgi:tetratricopeptide (TPR) repeat protein
MMAEQEHEIVPAIRGWLAATSDIEVPIGSSREDARRRGAELLARIASGNVSSDNLEVDDVLKDTLWAAVEDLKRKPLCRQTFEDSDRFYQFVLDMPLTDDPFDERDEILHRAAKIGWCSAPGGLDGILAARASVWQHGDETRHREYCETADQLAGRIEALKKSTRDVCVIREICTRLAELATVHPRLVSELASALDEVLQQGRRRIGSLDDKEFLKALVALVGAMAARQLGRWDVAKSGYDAAIAGFRRTADTSDRGRVDVERIALLCVRQEHEVVCQSAPDLIKGVRTERDRVKAKLILASSLLNLERTHEAKRALESALEEPAVEQEPCLKACLLTKLGMALSYEGRDREAMEKFGAAGVLLSSFQYPLFSADLTLALGEHLGRRGGLREAVTLYETARKEYLRIGQAQMVGYVSVLIAEAMILLGRREEAQAELVVALPLIEKFDLRREAIAAVTLLREAIGKRRTDVKTIQALREHLGKGLHR